MTVVPWLVEWIRKILTEIRTRYGIDPFIYVGIVVANTPFFYYFLFKTIRALARKETRKAVFFGGISLLLFQSPAIYVILFGRNLPWWAWAGVAALVVWGIYALISRLRRGR
jgi:hypothetical protein